MKHLIVSILLCVAAAACGDDGGEECVGHACPMGDISVTDADGGNILFEYIYFDTELATIFGLPSGVTTVNRVMAHFVNTQTPNNAPLPMPGQCFNFDATRGWPMFVQSPADQLDIGQLDITGKNTAGNDVTITVPKAPMAGRDSIGRTQQTYYQIITPNAANTLKFDSFYTVKFSGAGNIPATTYDDALFLSADFSVTMPDLEGNGPMTAGQDFTVRWNPATSMNLPPANTIVGGGVLGVTWLVDAMGSPTHMCAVGHDAGQFTIPGATIAEYRQVAMARGTNPDKVILLRNAIVHRLARLPIDREKRRIDMVTVNCWAQLMDVMQ